MSATARFSYLFLVCLLVASAPQAFAQEMAEVESGTGFFISPEYVVTNAHVLENGCAHVILRDKGKDWAEVKIIATDAAHDLAILYSKKSPRGIAKLRDNIGELKKGDKVVAMGYPLNVLATGNYERAVAEIVDPLNSQDDKNALQFSASTKQGYSGGPLMDSNGAVIGVVKAIIVKKTYESDNKGGGKIEEKIAASQQMDEAVRIPILEYLLMTHNVPYMTMYSASTNPPDNYADAVEADAKDFIVNVQCVLH